MRPFRAVGARCLCYPDAMPAVALPEIVVLDTETTGLDPENDRVIDIGAVRLGPDLEIVERFTTLVDPRVPIPLFITRLVGISDADVRGAPTFRDAFAQLREFAGDAVLAGHNVGFDRDHLAAGARRAGLRPLANAWFDTLEAALLLYPELDRHALAILAAEFGIERQAHRALPDAETAADVLARLCARAAGLGAEERGLLSGVRWEPLELLDRFRALPDEAPPPEGADEQTRAAGGPLPALPVDPTGWRAELGEDADEAAGPERAEPGLAARLPGFRRRPGQVQLAAAAAAVFESGGVGLFEAGTGMGKSLAYLLPAAFASAAAGRRIVVSTKTKALQRQLAAHELPIVADALPEGWRWTLLMGRENYICRRRLDEAVAAESETLPDVDRSLALAYLVGRARRGDVDLSALPYRASRELPALADLARELRSSRATCLGRHCPSRGGCHWRLARTRAGAAHLVCINHALLLTGPETLPPFEDVVIDEAHLLYQEATQAFSEEIGAAAVEALLADLRGRRRQRALPQRLRAAARRAEPGQARALAAAADSCERAAELLPDLVAAVGEALGRLGAVARDDDQDERAGGPRGGGNGQYNLTVWITPGLREHPAWDPFAVATSLLAEGLAALAAGVAPAAEALPDEHREHAAVVALAEDAAAFAVVLGELPESGGAEAVVWGEIEAAQRGPADAGFARFGASRAAPWTLTRTPLTPARHVREALWDKLRSAVLTSATLTVAGSFAYFRDMTGLDADVGVVERVFPSPFDFARQAVLVLEHDPGDTWRADGLAQRQGERLKRLAEVTGGRMVALFTNKRDMNLVAAEVGAHVEDDGVLVLAQGLHGSAAALADEFRTHPATILFGVDTLWTGQDFPGDTLTCLVIAKLPFPRQDPLFHARRRACDENGERWFSKFYLPEAVLKFRQGFGRLIRTETDTGVVVVLDHRLTQKSYRRDFIDSLPRLEVVEAAPAEIPAVVEHYLRQLTGDA